MKLSKRLAAILLLAVLLFALSGCSGTGANVFGITNPTTPLENAIAQANGVTHGPSAAPEWMTAKEAV